MKRKEGHLKGAHRRAGANRKMKSTLNLKILLQKITRQIMAQPHRKEFSVCDLKGQTPHKGPKACNLMELIWLKRQGLKG